jgi:hypothetical protein
MPSTTDGSRIRLALTKNFSDETRTSGSVGSSAFKISVDWKAILGLAAVPVALDLNR